MKLLAKPTFIKVFINMDSVKFTEIYFSFLLFKTFSIGTNRHSIIHS